MISNAFWGLIFFARRRILEETFFLKLLNVIFLTIPSLRIFNFSKKMFYKFNYYFLLFLKFWYLNSHTRLQRFTWRYQSQHFEKKVFQKSPSSRKKNYSEKCISNHIWIFPFFLIFQRIIWMRLLIIWELSKLEERLKLWELINFFFWKNLSWVDKLPMGGPAQACGLSPRAPSHHGVSD